MRSLSIVIFIMILTNAKKYIYEDEKGLHGTISGVNKKLGAKELGITSEYAEIIGYNIYYDIDKSDNIL